MSTPEDTYQHLLTSRSTESPTVVVKVQSLQSFSYTGTSNSFKDLLSTKMGRQIRPPSLPWRTRQRSTLEQNVQTETEGSGSYGS